MRDLATRSIKWVYVRIYLIAILSNVFSGQHKKRETKDFTIWYSCMGVVLRK